MAREQARFFWDDAWGPQPVAPPGNAGQGVAFAALPQGNASAPHLATETVTASAPAVSSAQSVAGVVTPLNGGSITGATGGQMSGGLASAGSGTITGSDDADAAGLALAALPNDGWFIVPSAANEYGQTYAAGEGGFEFDAATGSFTSDWFWV